MAQQQSASAMGLAAVSGCFAASASVFGKLGMSAAAEQDGSSGGGSNLNPTLFGVEVRCCCPSPPSRGFTYGAVFCSEWAM